MFFNGAQLNIRDSFSNGILIGASAGQFISSSNTDIIAIGLNSQRLIGAGSANVSVGDGSLNGVTGNRNTAMGSNALATTDSSDNTAIGYNANVIAYGGRNTAIGSGTSTFQQLYTANLNNTVIVINTKKIGGASVASFIAGAGLTVGQKYSMKIIFNGTAPAPFFPTTTLYIQMTVSNSDTLTMNQPAYTSQGSGNFDLYVYTKQNNSIAIGYSAATTGSNQIALGNGTDSTLMVNKFITDISLQPTSGQVYNYNSGTGKMQPVTLSVTINSGTYNADASGNINVGIQGGGGGGGNTNANVGSGYRLAIPGTNNIKTLHAGTNITFDSGAHANEITINAPASEDFSYHTATYGATTTIDYSTGEKFVLTLTGNTTLAFSNVVNGKTITVLLVQDGSGGHRVTLPANTVFPLGASTGVVLNTTTTANGVDKITISYNNVTTNYECELAKDYGH
jgi:hypothetical protein